MKPYEVIKIYMVSSGRLFIFIWFARYKSGLGLSPRTSYLLSYYTCISGSKFDKVFLALLQSAGKVYITLCQPSCFGCRIPLYLILHFIITVHWKFSQLRSTTSNCESYSFLPGQFNLTKYSRNICGTNIRGTVL